LCGESGINDCETGTNGKTTGTNGTAKMRRLAVPFVPVLQFPFVSVYKTLKLSDAPGEFSKDARWFTSLGWTAILSSLRDSG